MRLALMDSSSSIFRRFLGAVDVTFLYDLDVPPDTYDMALSLLGVGCLMGKETSEITGYLKRLHRSLRKGGSLLVIEIEKIDNLFIRIFFEDIFGLKEPPGLKKEN